MNLGSKFSVRRKSSPKISKQPYLLSNLSFTDKKRSLMVSNILSSTYFYHFYSSVSPFSIKCCLIFSSDTWVACLFCIYSGCFLCTDYSVSWINL